jgi:hypothetical protein
MQMAFDTNKFYGDSEIMKLKANAENPSNAIVGQNMTPASVAANKFANSEFVTSINRVKKAGFKTMGYHQGPGMLGWKLDASKTGGAAYDETVIIKQLAAYPGGWMNHLVVQVKKTKLDYVDPDNMRCNDDGTTPNSDEDQLKNSYRHYEGLAKAFVKNGIDCKVVLKNETPQFREKLISILNQTDPSGALAKTISNVYINETGFKEGVERDAMVKKAGIKGISQNDTLDYKTGLTTITGPCEESQSDVVQSNSHIQTQAGRAGSGRN